MPVKEFHEKQLKEAKEKEEASRSISMRARKLIDKTDVKERKSGFDTVMKRLITKGKYTEIMNSINDSTDRKLLKFEEVEKSNKGVKGIIWCSCCVKYIREDNCVQHVSGSKHLKKKSVYMDSKVVQGRLLLSLKNSVSITENVSEEVHLMRAFWLRQMLIAGVHTDKSDDLRPFIQAYCGHDVVSATHLRQDYLCVVRQEELELMRSEVKGKKLRISFDETELLWVCFCVVVGYIGDDGRMKQSVVRLALYVEAAEERTTNTLSNYVIVAITEALQVHDRNLIKVCAQITNISFDRSFLSMLFGNIIKVFTRDGVAINELAIKKLIGGELKDPNNNDRVLVYPGLYPSAVDVKCFSHTLDLCGGTYKKQGVSYSRLEGNELRTFFIHINGLFSGASNKPNKRWEVIMHSTMPSVSATRWWSKEEMYEYLFRWDTMDFPNVQKVIDTVKDYRPPQPQPPQPQIEDNIGAWVNYCKSLAQPCYDYFKEKVVSHPTMDLYRAAMYGNPEYMYKYNVRSAQQLRDDVQPLVEKRFIKKDLVNGMVTELAEYQLVCDEASTWTTLTYTERLQKIEDYWAVKRTKLAAWTEFAHTCMLLQPSSACVERAFSILKYIFTDQQSTSLGDLIETTLMLRYNRKETRETNE